MLHRATKLVSIHKPEHYDRVLPLFYNSQGVKAGGQVGFDDIGLFRNFRTTCTHTHKGILLHRDYSTLAEAIGYLTMWKEKIYLEGNRFETRIRRIMNGLLSWHDIFEIKNAAVNGEEQNVLIQQRWNTRSYRIVINDSRGDPYQLAKGQSLHGMLKALGLFDGMRGL